MSAHRYWRMVIPHGQRQFGGAGMSDVYLRDVDGIDRIANITASLTTFGTAMNLADGVISNVWGVYPINAAVFPIYLNFDFGLGNAFDITQVRIRALPGTYPLAQLQDAPAYFQWQYSDDNATWTTYFWGVQRTTWSLANNIATFNKPTADFSSGARYWALVMTDVQDTTSPVLTEVQLRAAIGGADVTTPSTPIVAGSTSAYVGFYAPWLVDDNQYTHWGSAFYEDVLALDLTSAQDVREILMRASSTATLYDNAPIAGYVLRSSDGAGFEEVSAWSIPPTWTQGAERLISWEGVTYPSVTQLKWPLFVGAL